MQIKFNNLDPRIIVDSIEIKDGVYYAVCHLKKTKIICPYCNKQTKSIHSSFTHTFYDIPIQNRPVLITLKKNKYICRNKECSCKTFSDKTDFISRKGRKTKRLIKNIVNLNKDLSSIQTSKDIESMGIIAKKSAICNYIKKNINNYSK